MLPPLAGSSASRRRQAADILSNQPIERLFQEIGEELRGDYTLGYTPEPLGSDFRVEKISSYRLPAVAI